MRLGEDPAEADKRDLAASFQAAVVDVIVDRVRSGLRLFTESQRGRPELRPRGLVIGGGVGANGAIRRALAGFCVETGLRFISPPAELCADNGAMIAWAGLERLRLGAEDDLEFAARPRWPLDAAPSAAHHGKA